MVEMLPLWVGVDLEAMTVKGTPHSPKLFYFWNFVLVLWPCWLFNAESCLYIYIYIYKKHIFDTQLNHKSLIHTVESYNN